MKKDLVNLPDGLPIPKDDGTCNHLLGMIIPDIKLESTKGGLLELKKIESNFLILYFFPMMAISEKKLPMGWDNIPGARGCTPQNIAINENMNDLLNYHVTTIGISTQSIIELANISLMRKFSQIILSDNKLKLKEKLNIPTFQIDNKIMYKRLTLVVKKSKIIKVFYPIFPPDKHIFEILNWLKNKSMYY
ncbi:MAG: peroxiredoxin [Nitrososphaeraceae archaeon]